MEAPGNVPRAFLLMDEEFQFQVLQKLIELQYNFFGVMTDRSPHP